MTTYDGMYYDTPIRDYHEPKKPDSNLSAAATIESFLRFMEFKKANGISALSPVQVMSDLSHEINASPEELFTLATKLIDGIYTTDDPFLYGERIAAIQTIAENGFAYMVDLDDVTPDKAVEYLLGCPTEYFIAIVDSVAKVNQSFYTAEWSPGYEHTALMDEINLSVRRFVDARPSLSEQMQTAATRVSPTCTASQYPKTNGHEY